MSCRKEFDCRHFGFGCTAKEAKSFLVLQWSPNRLMFFIYRIVMAMNSLGWTIGFYVWCKEHCPDQIEHSYRYITLWADSIRTAYFMTAAIFALIGLEKGERVKDQGLVKWLRIFVWFLHGIAMSSNTAVAIFFWPFVAPYTDPHEAGNVFNVYLHAVNMALMFIDLIFVAFPIRVFHAVYSMGLGMAYCLHTIILWQIHDTHAVYGILDWENNPKTAAVFFVASILVGSPSIQLFTFGLHLLRGRCHSAITKSREESLSDTLENCSLKEDKDETKHNRNSPKVDRL